ncbi:MAG: radical SAM protein [Deferribacteraceae bacterium]|jgi:histone acetyltransferase (RNA polymerase elongator complex component)|nr:radical SAM protein [Deferribacteraceae bacterium]
MPIFIPFMGCKSRCIYCNQYAISGVTSANDIIASVQAQMARWRATATRWDELAFYGGTFGQLPVALRHKLYELAMPLPIRYSTCPESITPELAAEMTQNNVSTVELGVQSLSERVLRLNGRNYSVNDVSQAFSLIPAGIKKACQLMVGMYGESQADVALTAAGLAALKPDYIRIYPTLILKNTELEAYFKDGRFAPLPASEILLRAAWLYIHGETSSSRVIRIGLPPEADDSEMIAGGWWHPACGELVRTLVIESWLRINVKPEIDFHPLLYGYKATLKERFAKLSLREAPAHGIMKPITANLRAHYSAEPAKWFSEQGNIAFAKQLGTLQ